jgi:calcineurin-like phosphoesterase family protein
MGKTFITGNMQLGRQSAIGKWKRPFSNVDSMGTQLIKNWNNIVSPLDTVYHIGNFAWDPKTAYDSLLALNAKKIYLMLGETDQPLLDLKNKGNLPNNVEIIDNYHVIDSLKITLNYWPIQEWPKKSKKHYGVIGYPSRKYKTTPKKKIINCSTEQCNYKPQDINSLLNLLKEIE